MEGKYQGVRTESELADGEVRNVLGEDNTIVTPPAVSRNRIVTCLGRALTH